MPEKTPSALSLALTYLRSATRWSMTRLARALGHADESLISHYERGAKALPREQLERILEPLGFPPESIDPLLFAHRLIFPERLTEEASSLVALTPEEHRVIGRAALAASWTAAEQVRGELIRRRKVEKIEAAKREAEEAFQRLVTLTREERRGLVEVFPDYWSWALAVRFCEGSIRKAAHKVAEALELADVALAIAQRVPGGDGWRSRLLGFCWAHAGNARRVANDLRAADEAFARAWELWRAGDDAEELLPEWRLCSLEASLRGSEHRFLEALDLLDKARAICGGDPLSIGRILMKKEHVLNQMGDVEAAFAVLAEVLPIIESSGDRRLLFALRFNMADNLCYLERFEDAAILLPKVRQLAVEQANELDLLRVTWLTARVDTGSRPEAAIVSLEQVCWEFTALELPYDAALSSLDLAVLWLKAGRMNEVRQLAIAMDRIFKMKGIHREALASLSLFCEAARQESVTEELARRVRHDIEKVRRSASPSIRGRGRG